MRIVADDFIAIPAKDASEVLPFFCVRPASGLSRRAKAKHFCHPVKSDFDGVVRDVIPVRTEWAYGSQSRGLVLFCPI
jgi:hypothetical protein